MNTPKRQPGCPGDPLLATMLALLTHPPAPVSDRDEVIKAGPDRGKTIGCLHNEDFDPASSDQEYLQSRLRHHGMHEAASPDYPQTSDIIPQLDAQNETHPHNPGRR